MHLPKMITRLQNSIYSQSIRHGLTLAIPFLIMGSFSLLLRNFPVDSYQAFIADSFGGAIAAILDTVFDISLGSLALVLTITISISYGLLVETDKFILYPIVSICSFLAFCGGIENQKEYIFSAEWVFTAMCITLLSCILFRKILRFSDRFERLHTTGAEYLFNLSIQSLIPAIGIVLFFALMGFALRLIWGDNNITNFGSYIFLNIFDGIAGNISGSLLYVLITHLLWFVGIHGTNTLDAVSNQLFEHNVEINQALVSAGQAPTEIFSKTFLDTFVFVGGCGCALSFILAICIAAKKSHNRKIAYVALPASLFNISEIAIFGFPIIYNFTMAIPFILTPVVLTLTSTMATVTGLVPAVTHSVEWTVPIFMSGYKATGSLAGSLLQLFNVVLGIFIYIPFIRRSEQKESEKFRQAVHQMEQDMTQGEKNGSLPQYLNQKYPYNYYAKTLAMDLQNALKRGQLKLFYQPQISDNGQLHGMEALLRWDHPVTGYIAPPVIIGLANECGILNELTYYLLDKACHDAVDMKKVITAPAYLSVNISPKQMQSDDFFERVAQIIGSYTLNHISPVLEITERAAMEISDYLRREMQTLKDQGIQFSLDDFGMGHNSLLQLQEGTFSEVKLDGQLVSQLLTNERSQDIIAGIIGMSRSLDCRIVAEFVETKAQRDMLKDLGCCIYQGYYFSRPLAPEQFIKYISELH